MWFLVRRPLLSWWRGLGQGGLAFYIHAGRRANAAMFFQEFNHGDPLGVAFCFVECGQRLARALTCGTAHVGSVVAASDVHSDVVGVA